MNGAMLDLAGRFGLARRSGGYGGDCPVCGYADAFTVRPMRDGRLMLFCHSGCDRDALEAEAAAALGSGWTPPPRQNRPVPHSDRHARQDRAQRLWEAARPCPGTLAEAYLARRGIGHMASSAALRFMPDCRHPGGTSHPALISAVREADGVLVAVQRTYLADDGRKAALDPARASLGPVWGAAVQLDPGGVALVIGEGMESSASAGQLLDLPAWAALSAGNLGRGLVLPAIVREVTIAADHDATGVGQKAAEAAAQRWRAEGRTVRIATPDRLGADFADLAEARMAEAAHG